MADLFVALIHYPVVDRNGQVVAAAVTSLDLHDIARSARTYGVRAFYVVHPVAAQREFALSVLDHWRLDPGRLYDSRRGEALDLVEITNDLDEAIHAATTLAGARPLLVYTSARVDGGISYAELRGRREQPEGPPLMLLFGTGFGLAAPVRARADLVLAPILGPDTYNHLSVRAAASIILDRLCGQH
jgi:hypothetical protein